MTADLYLFNVERGQCFAIRCDSGKWYIFDIGSSDAFSPLKWIINKYGINVFIEELTISHYHGDHLGDVSLLRNFDLQTINHVEHDSNYISDCFMSNSKESHTMLQQAIQLANNHKNSFRLFNSRDEIEIKQNCLSISEVLKIGGSVNTRVNNSSIISRIELCGFKVLVCGDMEASGWEKIFSKNWFINGEWLSLVEDVDILIAPHHGHSSGFSTELLDKTSPSIVLASVASKNPHVDSRYSDPNFVKGLNIGGETKKLLTTRSDGHIKITVSEGIFNRKMNMSFGDQVLC